MSKWILFHQTPTGDTIKYVSSELSQPAYIGYKDFFKNLKKYYISRRDEFQVEVEYFETILLNLDDGSWEVKKVEHKGASFEELEKINKPKEEKADDLLGSRLQKSKDFLVGFIKNKHKKKK